MGLRDFFRRSAAIGEDNPRNREALKAAGTGAGAAEHAPATARAAAAAGSEGQDSGLRRFKAPRRAPEE